MGPQLAHCKKKNIKLHNQVFNHSYLAYSVPGDYTVPADNGTISVAFKSQTAKTCLTLFIPQAKKEKYFFLYFFYSPRSLPPLSVVG